MVLFLQVSPMGQQLNVNECLNMKLGWFVLLANTAGGCQIGMPLRLTLVLPPLKLLLWLAVCQLLSSKDLLCSHQRSCLLAVRKGEKSLESKPALLSATDGCVTLGKSLLLSGSQFQLADRLGTS